MGTDDATILIAEPDAETAAAFAAQFAAAGATCAAAATAAQGLVHLAAGKAWAIVLSSTLPAADRQALAHAAHKHGVVALLAAPTADAAAYEEALELGCRAVVDRSRGAQGLAPVVQKARAHQRTLRQRREDWQRLKYQHEELRRHCAAQAGRFQETQETFFLDLSRMMTIISNIMDGIVFVDRDGNVTLMNPVAEDLIGAKSFVAIGRPLTALQGRPELATSLVADHARIPEQKELVRTVEVHHSEQDLLYIKCITGRVLDYRGQFAGVLSVLKDVTAEFKSDQLKNQYLSIVAHELRTPLTGIKTFSTMMAKGVVGPLNERQRAVVDSIREQSLRLEHQIDKLINLGQLEANEYGRDREVFHLHEFAAGLAAPFEQPARDRRLALTVTCDLPDLPLFGDRADLRRACQAILENAVKFTANGGTVAARFEKAPTGELRFVVRDDGIGIDPRYHRRIFEKFFQVEDPLTRHYGGAGLGLFVARGIVEAHGSRIEVSSQLGRGAEFSFALPVWRPQPPTVAATEGPAAALQP